jgi:hypothetical protein
LVCPQARGPLRGIESGIGGGVVKADVTDYFAVLFGYPSRRFVGRCDEAQRIVRQISRVPIRTVHRQK